MIHSYTFYCKPDVIQRVAARSLINKLSIYPSPSHCGFIDRAWKDCRCNKKTAWYEALINGAQQRMIVNKPLQAAGMSADRLSEK